MSWVKRTPSNAIDLKKNGDKPIEGVYVGKKNITTKIGEQVIWQFVDGDGEHFGVYGFTNLNMVMETVKEQTLCRLTYQGTKKVKTKYGMKDVHQVLVEVDTDGEEPLADDGGYSPE